MSEDDVAELPVGATQSPAVGSQSAPKANPADATRLIRAAGNGDFDRVIWLLDSKGDVNRRARGSSPLHEAAKGGHLLLVTELLRRAADLNMLNTGGCTPLHYAALCKDRSKASEVTALLLTALASVNATSERFDTALHYAAYHRSEFGIEQVMKVLLQKRANVNARNKNSETPLFNATINDNATAVKFLIASAADVSVRDKEDRTAQELAAERGFEGVLQVFRERKDPMAHLTDITHQMKTALNLMLSVDALSSELRWKSAQCEGFQTAATIFLQGLSTDVRVEMVEDAVARLQSIQLPGAVAGSCIPLLSSAQSFERGTSSASSSGAAGSGDVASSVAGGAAERQALLQALCTLVVISRSAGGGPLLHEAGLAEAVPMMEQLAAGLDTGHQEVRELRQSLGRSQAMERSASGMEGSVGSSTPNSDIYPLGGTLIVRPPSSTASGTTLAEYDLIGAMPKSRMQPRSYLQRPSARSMPRSSLSENEPCSNFFLSEEPPSKTHSRSSRQMHSEADRPMSSMSTRSFTGTAHSFVGSSESSDHPSAGYSMVVPSVQDVVSPHEAAASSAASAAQEPVAELNADAAVAPPGRRRKWRLRHPSHRCGIT